MKHITIELRGVEFHNKGAELMLYAILDKIRKELPSAEFVMEKTTSAPIFKQRAVGIYTKLNFKKFGLNAAVLGKLIPAALRKKMGFILEKDIDVVLDGSGFAFGDFWGAKKAGLRLADHIEQWKREGKKVIMLSQAFGEFEDAALKEKMQIIINNADLIFARDKYSHMFIKNIEVKKSNIHLRPDFTNLIKGKVPAYFNPETHQIGIIPNNKIVESKTFANREDYLEFLKTVVELISSKQERPFFLIHEGVKDLKLAEDVNKILEYPIPVLTVDDPLHVKGIIGASKGLVTSRFHGLVSALSQGIPCLCIGWSHKYLALMEDYGYPEGLIKDESLAGEELVLKLNLILNLDSVTKIRERLMLESIKQKELSEDMWKMVIKEIQSN